MAKDRYGNTVEIGSLVQRLRGGVGEVIDFLIETDGHRSIVFMYEDGVELTIPTSTLAVIGKKPESQGVLVAKPYFVEAYEAFYPGGGHKDIYSGFDSADVAKIFASENKLTRRTFCSVLTIDTNGKFKVVSKYSLIEGWIDAREEEL